MEHQPAELTNESGSLPKRRHAHHTFLAPILVMLVALASFQQVYSPAVANDYDDEGVYYAAYTRVHLKDEPYLFHGISQYFKSPLFLSKPSFLHHEKSQEENNQPPHVDFANNVEEALQFPLLPAGCEVVSLTAVLRSMGFEISLTEIADNHLVINYEGDFAYGFSGSPYDTGGGFPPAIVDAANSYLSQFESSYHAYNLTGTDFAQLRAWVETGYPVLIWTTMYMSWPDFTDIYIDEFEWYNNEHCVVLYGFDGDRALVNDPFEGLVSRDLERFIGLYEACGAMAVVIV